MGNFHFLRSDPLEVGFFRMGKLLLGFLGVWPLDSVSRLTKIKSIINLVILLIAIIVGELRFTWLVRDDHLTAINAICPSLTKIVTGMKLACFIIYRKKLAILLNDLYEHLAVNIQDPLKNSMVAEVSHFTKIWWIVLTFFGLAGNLLFSINPLIKWIFQWLSENKNTWIDLPFQAAMPYKDMTRLNNKLLYSLVYCFLVYSGCVTVLGFPGADGTFMCFCMYFSVSYKCLHEDIKQAFKMFSETDPCSNNLLYKHLSMIVKRQEQLNKMYKRFNEIYKFMIFGHFVFASITLGIALINLVLTSGMSRMVNFVYVLGACTQLYTYCYGPEKVNHNHLKLAETYYFSDWYNCNKKVKSLILFTIMHSQRGSLLRAPFFWPSLPLFASIIQTSGSYFTLLETIL